MMNADYDAFVGEFRRLAAALERYKLSPAETSAKADVYFQVLKKFTLIEVTAKADHWLASETRMPKPVEWASVIVRRTIVLNAMTLMEAQAYAAAEAAGWEGEACGCQSCVEAGVTDKPLRFVPDFDANDTTITKTNPLKNDRAVATGHWAHGDELRRWYVAKDAFWQKVAELKLMSKAAIAKAEKMPLEKRIEQIFKKKGEVPPP